MRERVKRLWLRNKGKNQVAKKEKRGELPLEKGW